MIYIAYEVTGKACCWSWEQNKMLHNMAVSTDLQKLIGFLPVIGLADNVLEYNYEIYSSEGGVIPIKEDKVCEINLRKKNGEWLETRKD